MADIEYQCHKCGAARVVSEFADVSKIKCAACGGGLRKAGDPPPPPDRDHAVPVSAPPPPGVSRLKIAQQQRAQSEQETPFGNGSGNPAKKQAATPADGEAPIQPLELHPRVKRKSTGPSNTLLAFLLFGVIGVATGYLRYAAELNLPGADKLPSGVLESVRNFAWIGVVALNLLVVGRAMADNMFHGILCLLVPGWSVIYLLFISDNFYMRAVVFGCMIGLAQDGGVQIYDGAATVAGNFKAFIDSGGGEVRRAPPRR